MTATHTVSTAAGGVGAGLLAVPAHAQDFAPYYGHMMWGGGMMLGGILWFLVMIGLGVGVVMFLTRGTGSLYRGRSEALEILKSRFARGEITKEEFEDRRRTIGD